MKLIPTSTLAAMMMILSIGGADAAPWWRPGRTPRPVPPPPPAPHHHAKGPAKPAPHRLEVRAQIRLRELGYYRGPIDGAFGKGSRAALVRFQRDYRLPMTGRLDARTIRALRI